MPSYTVTDPKSGKSVTITGDSPPTEADLDEIFSAVNADLQSQASSITTAEDVPVAAGIPATPAPAKNIPEPSLSDKSLAALKAGGVMIGNAIPATIGALGGSVYGVGRALSGLSENGESMQKGAELLSPFSTQDPLANQYMQNVGEALSPLAGLPIGPEINALSGMAPAAARQALSKPARMIEASRENKADIVNRIASGAGDKDLAKLMLDRKIQQQAPEALPPENQLKLPAPTAEGGGIDTTATAQKTQIPATIKAKAVKDPLAIEAIKQGYDEGLIASIKSENPETQREMLRMVNNSEEGKKNRKFAIDNRPADIAGDALSEKLDFIKRVKSDAGLELDKIVDKLANKPVDTDPAINSFIDDLAQNGVKLDEKNNPIYTGSIFEGDDKSQKIINIIVRRAKESSMTDAKGAHNLKKFIDDKTNYGVSKEGLSGDAERIVKKFRAGIDDALDTTFEDYNKANTKYADSISALNNFQKAAGGTVDLFGPNADKALGTLSRRILGNPASRANILTSLDEIDNVSKKYGADFKVNIKSLADFANELDRVHGAHASTSLLGDVEKGVSTGIKNAQRDLSQTTLTGAILQGGAKAYDYLNRITPETQYKSIKELLARDAKKEANK